MAGVLPYLKGGPDTCKVAAAITAGQLVIPDATDHTLINVAGDAAKNVLGVAGTSGGTRAAPGSDVTAGDVGDPLNIAQLPDYIPVHYDVDIKVKYSAAVLRGALLAAAATGQVRAWVSGDGPDAIVGRCTEPGGVTTGGTVARARIFG